MSPFFLVYKVFSLGRNRHGSFFRRATLSLQNRVCCMIKANQFTVSAKGY